MTIKNAFIPCAGKGTRMGPAGRRLAKPLWPIFDKKMLDLQLSFLGEFGSSNFFINTHFLSDQFERYLESTSESVTLLYEKELLGSGGCFYNLKESHSSLDKVLILNSDVQIFLSEHDQARLQADFEKNDAVLVCIPVEKKSLYNEVCFDEHFNFTNVSVPNVNSNYYTYSGFGMVNLSCLRGDRGVSSFFETVLTGKGPASRIFIPRDNFEYWDWGTEKLYVDNILSLASSPNSLMRNFLKINNLMNEKLLSLASYNHKNKNIFNFTSGDLVEKTDPGIYFKDQMDELLHVIIPSLGK